MQYNIPHNGKVSHARGFNYTKASQEVHLRYITNMKLNIVSNYPSLH